MIDCENNDVQILSEMKGDLKIRGRDNKVRIGSNCALQIMIHIIGSNNTLIIDRDCIIGPSFIGITNVDGALISIGAGTSAGRNFSIQAHEASKIVIGADCMISTDVFITSSDMHPIYDISTGQRINPAKSICLKDHVWIGYNVTITKGVTIGPGSIIGTGAIVNCDIPENVLAAGVPARVIRAGVEWKRNFSDPPSAGYSLT